MIGLFAIQAKSILIVSNVKASLCVGSGVSMRDSTLLNTKKNVGTTLNPPSLFAPYTSFFPIQQKNPSILVVLVLPSLQFFHFPLTLILLFLLLIFFLCTSCLYSSRYDFSNFYTDLFPCQTSLLLYPWYKVILSSPSHNNFCSLCHLERHKSGEGEKRVVCTLPVLRSKY